MLEGDGWVAAERGYLREAGNLLFHLAVVVVLVGFAVGGLFGYKGGVILVVGNGFSNNLTQYDDFDPGSLFDPGSMEPFSFKVDDFDVEWIDSGPRQGMAQGFNAHLTYREAPGDEPQQYDLKVNHPLKIGGTEVFLIGHGYAPIITIRDGNGDVAYSGPTVFLPEDAGFRSFGVVKAPDAEPVGIGLEGLFFPTYLNVDGDPVNVMGDLKNPTLSMQAWTGDLGMDDGSPSSVYELDTARATKVTKPDGSMFRVDLQPGPVARPARRRRVGDVRGRGALEQAADQPHARHARHPGRRRARPGRSAAVAVHPAATRVGARAARDDDDGTTTVEVAGLDRSTAGDVQAEVAEVTDRLRQLSGPKPSEKEHR